MPRMVLLDEQELRALIRDELEQHEARKARRGLSRGDRDLLSTAEAADLVGVRPSTIRAWVRSGKVQAHGTARLLRVSRAELLELMKREGPPALIEQHPPGHRSPEQEADDLLRRHRRSRNDTPRGGKAGTGPA